MGQKLLKFFLVGRVQEHYFINFVVVSAAFLAFHPQGFRSYLQDSDFPLLQLTYILLLVVALAFLAWKFVKTPNHTFVNGNRKVVSFIPLICLAPVSLFALLTVTAEAKNPNAFEVLLSLMLLLFYGTRLGILIFYSFLERFDFTKNFLYRAIQERFEAALGDYQISLREAGLLIVVAVSIVFLLRLTDLNPYSQYVTAFSMAEVFAHGMRRLRDQNIRKN